jgi:DNA-binding PadR family transcriptional regulator
MSRHAPTNNPKSGAHLRMLHVAVADGLIRRVGDSYEITDAGHEYTVRLCADLPTTSTFESNEP